MSKTRKIRRLRKQLDTARKVADVSMGTARSEAARASNFQEVLNGLEARNEALFRDINRLFPDPNHHFKPPSEINLMSDSQWHEYKMRYQESVMRQTNRLGISPFMDDIHLTEGMTRLHLIKMKGDIVRYGKYQDYISIKGMIDDLPFFAFSGQLTEVLLYDFEEWSRDVAYQIVRYLCEMQRKQNQGE